MQSEHTSIDQFFRKKEEAFTPGNQLEELHWQQMKSMLAAGSVLPVKRRRQIIRRRIIGYAGGFVIVTVLITIAVHSINSYTKKAKAATAVNHKNTVMRPLNHIPVTAARSNNSVFRNNPADNSKSITQKPNPVYIQSNSLRSVTPQPADHVRGTAISRQESPDAAALLSRFYSQLQQAPQEFTIRGTVDTTLVAKEGTRLHIPAWAFVRKTGEVVTGTVKIFVEEFYSYDKMIAAGLGTASNGDQLISGGMLHIVAVSNGHELQLQPSVNIAVKMPTNNYDGRMQLFTGNAPANKPKFDNNFTDAAQVSFHTEVDTPAYKAPGMPVDINWTAADQWQDQFTAPTIRVWDLRNNPSDVHYGANKTVATYSIYAPFNVDMDQVKKELEKRYAYYYDEIKVKRVTKNYRRELLIGGKRGVETIGDSVNLSFADAIKNKLVSAKDSLAYVQTRTTDSIFYYTHLGTLKKEYSFNISTLGWVNCDRFARDPRPKVAFTLNLGEGTDAHNFQAHLVFTRYESVMTGYYGSNKLLFDKIPDQEAVQLVCVGVKEGKVVACVQPLTTSAREVNNLHFEETTPEQFRSKLQSLGLR